MSKIERFSNRWGIVFASLGMAIGAGNLWRFPRLAGQYGGAFIVLWIFFLLIWSVPLLMAEFAIGKRFRKGVIGSLGSVTGKSWTWMGFFVTTCTLGIAFYYAVVTAWALRYLAFSVQNAIVSNGQRLSTVYLEEFWFTVANGSAWTIGTYILVIGLAALILVRGIKGGLEKANNVLIPCLFILLTIILMMSLSMPGGLRGLEYMFKIDFSMFLEPIIWVEALSQSAWSTGAGWGLMMTLSSYTSDKEDIALNTVIGAFGNNTASLLAGMAILPAVFATSLNSEEAIEFLKAGNQALTFSIIPRLFGSVSGGQFLSVIFFLALSLAAFTSFLSMMEMFIRNLSDLQIVRQKVIAIVSAVMIVFGFPSAYYLEVFNNQDWVWGLGLIVSGFLILVAIMRYGPGLFKEALIDPFSDINFSTHYFRVCIVLSLILAPVLLYWWLSRGYSTYPWFDIHGNWNFMDVYSNASVVSQWGFIILLGLVFNNLFYQKLVKK